ncbi:MAG TPA: RluA family pseudouridine synthase [Phycisphaerae bacterium]|nr:RluA family pseudouridine synthase [Phycisphaerae bacterium]
MNSPGEEDAEILDRPVPLVGEETRRARVKVRRRLPGRRLDKYLHSRFPRMSRTLLQRLIKQGAVTVNGLPTKPSYEPTAGDVVELVVPPPEPADIVREDIPLDIIYEDDYLLAINKTTGIICHPARGGQTGTIANAVAFYADQLSHGTDPFRPGIVHRLDKNTTGVMLIAKTDEAHWRLSMQFERRTIDKTYFGIVEGEPRLDGDLIDMPLGAHPTLKGRYMIPGMPVRPILFKEAVTQYEVAERFKGFAVVHLHPKTGRTHQLRVHMSAIGHPMMGDTFYGGHLFAARDITGEPDASTDPLIPYQSLHALRISFMHPIQEKPVTIEAPLPAELQSIVEMLRKHRAY